YRNTYGAGAPHIPTWGAPEDSGVVWFVAAGDFGGDEKPGQDTQERAKLNSPHQTHTSQAMMPTPNSRYGLNAYTAPRIALSFRRPVMTEPRSHPRTGSDSTRPPDAPPTGHHAPTARGPSVRPTRSPPHTPQGTGTSQQVSRCDLL